MPDLLEPRPSRSFDCAKRYGSVFALILRCVAAVGALNLVFDAPDKWEDEGHV